jgi:hypothetical protein
MRIAGAMLNACENLATAIHSNWGDSHGPAGTYAVDGKALSNTEPVPGCRVVSPAACFRSKAAQQKGENAPLMVA